ncbi:hypothetical protein [Corynebacterium aquatimens]|uniref:Uncharacterized protein n=1 Tax=Corynebacterium aquatimens TaxID=1190508 RepID=A0A931GU18_9CORY|nr:hypothetical protein [Corynebacterium aquatimens]MBG6122340.1 hypothetical protein [Corynebacterium aquatimens]
MSAPPPGQPSGPPSGGAYHDWEELNRRYSGNRTEPSAQPTNHGHGTEHNFEPGATAGYGTQQDNAAESTDAAGTQTRGNSQGRVGAKGVEGGPSISKKVLLPVIAVLAALALVAVGLAVWRGQSSADSPLGWDDERVERYFENDKLVTCQLGQDFYTPTGYPVGTGHSPELCIMSRETTLGMLGAFISIDWEDALPLNDLVPAKGEGLSGWRETEDPVSYVADPIPNAEERGLYCMMRSEDLALEKLSLWANAPCEALHPLAQQFTNLAQQYKHASGNGDATYVQVRKQDTIALETSPYQRARGEAKNIGEPIDVDDPTWKGTTASVDAVEHTGDDGDRGYCVDVTFTLGEAPDPDSEQDTVDVPNFVTIFPNGQVHPLTQKNLLEPLEPGVPQTEQYCGAGFTSYLPVELLIGATDSAGEVTHFWLREFDPSDVSLEGEVSEGLDTP